jgi:hypothetical protein
MPFFVWFDPAVGIPTPPGMSAFQIAVAQGTYIFNHALTLDQNINAWLESLKGEQGPSGLPAIQYYEQTEPLDTWVIVHNFGFRPNINVVDSNGDVVFCGINHFDTHTVTLSFGEPFAGIATLS